MSRSLVSPVLLVGALTLGACARQSPGAQAPTAIAPASARVATSDAPIAHSHVEAAQRAWCDALLSISKAATTGHARDRAAEVLSTAYNYDRGAVLFKPTLTHGTQTFRFDERGALAYFVGGDPAYPDDKGFALKPWATCQPTVASVVQHGEMAVAMGNVVLTDTSGKETKVDKTFGYVRGADGALRIVVHHSSLPYTHMIGMIR